MNKIKRKQIYYEGNENQYIKGNGELGEFSDEIVYCTFTKNDTSTLHGDGTITMNAAEIYDALEKGKTVICKYEFNQYHESKIIELNVANVNVRDYISDKIFIINFTTIYNHTVYVITVQWRGTLDYSLFNTWYAENNSWDDDSPLPIELFNVQNQSATINQNIKTFNDEYIDTDGNSNLHDGFYFPNAIQDYDGNWYGAVIIGNQVWLAENLRTTHFSNGTVISEGDALSEIPAYQDKTSSNIPLQNRGLYYNWYAVLNGNNPTNNNPSNIQGVSPIGFHIPSLSEFEQLQKYLAQQNRYSFSGWGSDSMKTISSVDYWTTWNPTNGGIAPGYKPESNNKSGLNLVPTGKLDEGEGTSFYLWTATNGSEENKAAYFYGIDGHRSQTMARFVVSEDSCENYTTYFPIRCISNLNPTQFRNWYIKQYGSLQHHLQIAQDGGNSISESCVFNIKANEDTVVEFRPSQESSTDLDFEAGVGITIEGDEENGIITISSESNHTVVNKQLIVTGEQGASAYYYDVRCDLNGSILKVGNLTDFCNKNQAYPYENNYVWTKTANDTGIYIGLCRLTSTEGKFVFKLDINNSIDNTITTHYFGLLADAPPDSTFTFVTTCTWNIHVRLNSSSHYLLGYLEVPDEFVGTIILTPLRYNFRSGSTVCCFDETSNYYGWQNAISGGTQNVDLITTLSGDEPTSSGANKLRIPSGNYYVNLMGDFGVIDEGSKISDSMVNDYYLHTLEKRVQWCIDQYNLLQQSTGSKASLFTLLGIPEPNEHDAGKVLAVNVHGDYELMQI